MQTEQDSTSDPRPSPVQPLAGLRVLLVEDNDINLEIARIVLEQVGASVETATDGAAAVARLEKQPQAFDAVLMDIQMPVMDGYEATRIIRRRLGLTSLPIIAMTANDRVEDRREAALAGMDVHLSKPIDANQLIAILKPLAPGGRLYQQDASSTAGVAKAPAAQPEQFPDFDLRTALIRLGGDRATWLSLMRQFESTQGGVADEVGRLLAEGREGDAARLMHRLRGVAANLGAVAVARLAVEAESAIKDGHGTSLPDLLGRLRKSMASVFAMARSLQEEVRPAPTPTSVSRTALLEGLTELRQLLADNNMKALARFEALRSGAELSVGIEPVRSLAAAIETLDFARASELVLNMVQMITDNAKA